MAIPLSVSVELDQPLKRFIDSVEKVVFHTRTALRLHSIIVFWTNPIHSTGHARRLDNASRNHRSRALWTRLAYLNRILILTKTGSGSLTEFCTRCHYLQPPN